MSQSAVAVTPSGSSNKTSISGSKDTDPSSTAVSSRLRSNRQSSDVVQTATKGSVPAEIPNREAQSQNSSVDAAQSVDASHARMTRQRTAIVVPQQDQRLLKQDDTPPPSAAAEGLAQICLCQPDPKIPRPRNAFILYRIKKSPSIVADHPRLSNPEISKIAGELWRAESEDVKNFWRSQAELEKLSHAQKYPDYQFRPKHKKQTSPTSAPGDNVACQKCGGLSITSNTNTPVATPSTKEARVKFTSATTSPSTPSSGKYSRAPSRRQSSMMLNTTGHPHPNDPRYTPTSATYGTRKYPDSAIEISDAKRRRFEQYPAATPSQPQFVRNLTYQGDSRTTHIAQEHPSPRIDLRRGSLPSPEEVRYVTTHGPPAYSTASPPVTPHGLPVHTSMGPPASRPASLSLGTRLPPTPSSAYLPSHRPRTDSEALRLPPIRSPGHRETAQNIAAMIMSIEPAGKIKTLRKICPPIREPEPGAAPHRVRGSVIAIEGDDSAAAVDLLKQLETFLRRNDEFDVRVMTGPDMPGPKPTFKDYLAAVTKWHEQTKGMVDFVTGVEYHEAIEAEKEATEPPTVRRPSVAVSSSVDLTDTDTEDGEVLEGTRKDSHDARARTRAAALEQKKVEMAASIERESRRQSALAKIPLLLVSNYILHGANAWSSALPIDDIYSPVDHWQWASTLWRGVAGADMTVYVSDVEREKMEPVSAGVDKPATNAASAAEKEKKVEMKDDISAILVKRKAGKVDDGSIRRIAFEVGEYVRSQAGKLS